MKSKLKPKKKGAVELSDFVSACSQIFSNPDSKTMTGIKLSGRTAFDAIYLTLDKMFGWSTDGPNEKYLKYAKGMLKHIMVKLEEIKCLSDTTKDLEIIFGKISNLLFPLKRMLETIVNFETAKKHAGYTDKDYEFACNLVMEEISHILDATSMALGLKKIKLLKMATPIHDKVFEAINNEACTESKCCFLSTSQIILKHSKERNTPKGESKAGTSLCTSCLLL